ncbi:MAG: CinA family protein [Lachnospirales bacterium]
MIDLSLKENLVSILKDKKYKLAACESCTGGMFISSLIDISGTSDIIDESYITYSNEAKSRLLGVSTNTLETYGAVSYETAYEMVEGLYNRCGANVTVSITGIAGPLGGTTDKPVGLCYIGYDIEGTILVEKINNTGSRVEIREKTVIHCMNKLINLLEEK